jgi:hypothetical protein
MLSLARGRLKVIYLFILVFSNEKQGVARIYKISCLPPKMYSKEWVV